MCLRDGDCNRRAHHHSGVHLRITRILRKIMKSKALIVFSTVIMALALMAQSTTQPAPSPSGNNPKACACCGGDTADSKTACCGKAASCCGKDGNCGKGSDCCQGKDGKSCPMMSKDSSGKMSCCADGKCSMSEKTGKSCCGGKMCPRSQAGA